MNQTLEFPIRGRWIRWAPYGFEGSIQEISNEERMDPEFVRLQELYFTVKEVSK
jgi:hypothetical protein